MRVAVPDRDSGTRRGPTGAGATHAVESLWAQCGTST
jgi:hypothetical protein